MSPTAGERHKVLLFIPNLQQGGAERQILELMTRLPPRFETTLCLYEDVVHYREYLPPGEPRHVLGTRAHGTAGAAAARRGVAAGAARHPALVPRQGELLGAPRARSARVPIVITAVRSRAMHVLHLATEWWLSERSDRVIANSEGVRRELVGLAGVAPEKVQILHNFIDLEKFHPPTPGERAAARARWGVGPRASSRCCSRDASDSRSISSGSRSRSRGSSGRGACRRACACCSRAATAIGCTRSRCRALSPG